MQFLKLNDAQRERFGRFKTTDQMQYHGPLAEGEKVPVHEHDRALYLLSEGRAQFVQTDGTPTEILGQGQQFDAVVVEAGEAHGWVSRAVRVVIEHIIGHEPVEMVLVAA